MFGFVNNYTGPQAFTQHKTHALAFGVYPVCQAADPLDCSVHPQIDKVTVGAFPGWGGENRKRDSVQNNSRGHQNNLNQNCGQKVDRKDMVAYQKDAMYSRH